MVYVSAEVRRKQLIDAAKWTLQSDGIAQCSLRAVASRAGVPLGTMQYVFSSKESLLRAVIESVIDDISIVLETSADVDHGLENAIHTGISTYWEAMVHKEADLQIMQYELTTYALRSVNQQDLAGWQYSRYVDIVANWFKEAAERSGETCAMSFLKLARLTVALLDGIILQYVCDRNSTRARSDVSSLVKMIVRTAGISAEGAVRS